MNPHIQAALSSIPPAPPPSGNTQNNLQDISPDSAKIEACKAWNLGGVPCDIP